MQGLGFRVQILGFRVECPQQTKPLWTRKHDRLDECSANVQVLKYWGVFGPRNHPDHDMQEVHQPRDQEREDLFLEGLVLSCKGAAQTN